MIDDHAQLFCDEVNGGIVQHRWSEPAIIAVDRPDREDLRTARVGGFSRHDDIGSASEPCTSRKNFGTLTRH
jgi:hypothetical protein